MLRGVGVDIVETEHVRAQLEAVPAFSEMTFSKKERELASNSARPLCFYSGRFAAKEAVYKALNFTKFYDAKLRDIEILCDGDGAPVVSLTGALAKKMEACYPECSIEVSISHGNGYTIAFAQTELDADDREKTNGRKYI